MKIYEELLAQKPLNIPKATPELNTKVKFKKVIELTPQNGSTYSPKFHLGKLIK